MRVQPDMFNHTFTRYLLHSICAKSLLPKRSRGYRIPSTHGKRGSLKPAPSHRHIGSHRNGVKVRPGLGLEKNPIRAGTHFTLDRNAGGGSSSTKPGARHACVFHRVPRSHGRGATPRPANNLRGFLSIALLKDDLHSLLAFITVEQHF